MVRAPGRAWGFVVLLLALLVPPAHAQRLTVLGLDTTSYPIMRARILAYGADGTPIRDLFAEDVTVTEEGISREVVELSCPDLRAPEPISSVLAVDVSGSMTSGAGADPNIAIARAAAAAWVDALPPGVSESAVTSFDHRSYLNLDFTTDRTKLHGAIDALTPQGGTSYDAGFITPGTGALHVAAGGRNRRVVVFLTDGRGGGNEAEIIALAKRQNVIVYCVTLGMPMPEILRDIAEATGGGWYENVTSAAEAAGIYRTILELVQGGTPCVLSWRGDTSCVRERCVTISFPILSLTSTVAYLLPDAALPRLAVDPVSLAFGAVEPGSSSERTITLTAPNRMITVRSIVPNDPRFTITAGGAPREFTLAPGERHEVKIRFTPTDSSVALASLAITADACTLPAPLLSGGYPGRRPSVPSLTIVKPNGGERFTAGTDTEIEWRGVLPTEEVRLEYSIDAGQSWKNISDAAVGLRYLWHVPATPSERCLARVRQASPKETRTEIGPFPGRTNGVGFSPDGRYVVSASEDAARIWESPGGAGLHTLVSHARFVAGGYFSPDGSMVVTVGGDNEAHVWNIASGSIIARLVGHVDAVSHADFSPDGTRVATVSRDMNVGIWDPLTGELKTSFGPAGYASVRYAPDGNRVVVAEPFAQQATVWDIATGTMLLSLTGHNGPVFHAAYGAGGTRIVTASGDRTAKVWDAFTGAELMTLSGHDGIVLVAEFSPDGGTIVTGGNDSTVRVWDASSGALLRTFTLPGFVRSVRVSADGDTIFVGLGSSAVILDLSPLQHDLSDDLWAIEATSLRGSDVDFGAVTVGAERDSVVKALLCNTGGVPATVREVFFTGPDAADFDLVSGPVPAVVPPGGCATVEIRFRPGAALPRTGTMEIVAGGDTIRSALRGIGVEGALRLVGDLLDFGSVRVGSFADSIMVQGVMNPGASPVEIADLRLIGPDDAQFSIVAGGGAFTLGPGEGRDLHLRFSPAALGGTSGRIGFFSPTGERLALLELFGRGICGSGVDPLAVAFPSTIEAAPGDTVELPLRIFRSGGSDVGAGEFAAQIRFDGTLMTPLEWNGAIYLEGDERVLAINGSKSSEGDTLIMLRCIVGLGAAESTPITIENFAWRGCGGPTGTIDGELRLLEICRETTPRLFLSNGFSALKPARPNPAADGAEIPYEIIEPGRTRLYVTDLAGRRVVTLADAEMVPGSYVARLDLTGLSSGVYLCVLETPTQRMTGRIQVER